MIKSRADYLYYLRADAASMNKKGRPSIFKDDIWRYVRLLRKVEYFNNCRRSIFWLPYRQFLKYRFRRRSIVIGMTIPLNVFGAGLSIAHYGTIVVNGCAKIGENCRIHTCVNIGTAAGSDGKAPKIGDNVYIGPGAKLFGDITIGDNVVIGANSVVNKSFESNVTIGGIPAKVISNKNSEELLLKGSQLGNR